MMILLCIGLTEALLSLREVIDNEKIGRKVEKVVKEVKRKDNTIKHVLLVDDLSIQFLKKYDKIIVFFK
jgi:hypothetical protein